MTNITPEKLDQAREWARTAINTPNNFPKVHAAAEIIQSLPDQWIDADELREVFNEFSPSIPLGGAERVLASRLADACLITADLPEPTRFNHRDEPRWEVGSSCVNPGAVLAVSLTGPYGEGWEMHAPAARDLAAALLAAAAHAEKGKK